MVKSIKEIKEELQIFVDEQMKKAGVFEKIYIEFVTINDETYSKIIRSGI